MKSRFTREHIDAWRRDGAVLIPNFFTRAEVAAVQRDYRRVFDRAGARSEGQEALVKKKDGEIGKFNPAQFSSIQVLPVDASPALNLVGVHPALIDFARRAMACEEVSVYQCQAWAKFTGDADYDQPFHCDYVNHTLTAPSDVDRFNSVTFICLFSDVTEAHGPTHYVTRPDAEQIAGPEATLTGDPALQEKPSRHERSAAAPAGSLFVYGIDIWHRGTNLTAPGGHRYVMTTCFKDARTPRSPSTPGSSTTCSPGAHLRARHARAARLLRGAAPGDPYWTELTLARAQARYPGGT